MSGDQARSIAGLPSLLSAPPASTPCTSSMELLRPSSPPPTLLTSHRPSMPDLPPSKPSKWSSLNPTFLRSPSVPSSPSLRPPKPSLSKSPSPPPSKAAIRAAIRARQELHARLVAAHLVTARRGLRSGSGEEEEEEGDDSDRNDLILSAKWSQ